MQGWFCNPHFIDGKIEGIATFHDMPTDPYQIICENGKWNLNSLSSNLFPSHQARLEWLTRGITLFPFLKRFQSQMHIHLSHWGNVAWGRAGRHVYFACFFAQILELLKVIFIVCILHILKRTQKQIRIIQIAMIQNYYQDIEIFASNNQLAFKKSLCCSKEML